MASTVTTKGLVGRVPAEVFHPGSNIALVAIVRGDEVVGKEHLDRFMAGDLLLLAGSVPAKEAFIRAAKGATQRAAK